MLNTLTAFLAFLIRLRVRTTHDRMKASSTIALSQPFSADRPVGRDVRTSHPGPCDRPRPDNEPCAACVRSQALWTYFELDDLPAWAMREIEEGL